MSKYKDTLDYMYAQLPMYQRIGAQAYKKDLNNTIALCKSCGDPQLDFPSIHIAGTNGKGTTTHIIAGCLQAQGYKVGVYTSPHYKDFRERIKINGEYISRKYITKFIDTYKIDLEYIKPSFFEMTVALAFSYFRDQGVDYAIIETGLGGRLDSTNIIMPLMSVITNISLDHQSMLGDTLIAIAGEKAGIIKPHIPVVIGETQEDIKHVFDQKSIHNHSPISYADQQTTLILKSDQKNGLLVYDVHIDDQLVFKDLTTTLVGPFQSHNLITALFSIYKLSHIIKIDFEAIADFFPSLVAETKYIGRWQIMGQSPLTIADSAHNEGGLKIILNELKNYTYQQLHIVLGFVNDKDVGNILKLFPISATYYFAKADIPRGLDAASLRTSASQYGLQGKAYRSVRQALAAARMSANKSDLIYVGGSIFVVAEVL
jgi:dihydrofolate synthase / folylpolyglutamate synthase